MTRIGVIADNHSQTTDGSDVPSEVLQAFSGADLIVHCGDAGSWASLDRLATVAPVVGVQGGHNGMGDDDRIAGTRRVIDVDGLRAGVVHDLVAQGVTTESQPTLKPVGANLGAALINFFGERVQVVLYAGTHVPRVAYTGGILLVNPGSPTIPLDRPKGSLGSVAILECDGGIATARIVELWRRDVG